MFVVFHGGVATQTYRELRPGPELAPYVTCVWIQEVAPGSAPYTHRTVPNGSAALGVPASELVDLTVPADELWGPTAAGERVAGAASAQQAAAVLADEVLARVAAEPDPVAAEAGSYGPLLLARAHRRGVPLGEIDYGICDASWVCGFA